MDKKFVAEMRTLVRAMNANATPIGTFRVIEAREKDGVLVMTFENIDPSAEVKTIEGVLEAER